MRGDEAIESRTDRRRPFTLDFRSLENVRESFEAASCLSLNQGPPCDNQPPLPVPHGGEGLGSFEPSIETCHSGGYVDYVAFRLLVR